MAATISKLGEIIDARKVALDLPSDAAVCRRSERFKNGPIDAGTLGKWRRGRVQTITPTSVRLLARTLEGPDDPEESLFARMLTAANLPVGAGGQWEPPDEVELLDKPWRDHLDSLIRLAARTRTEQYRRGGDPPTPSGEGDDPTPG